MKTKQDAIFRRAELLLGDEAMKQIAQKRVIIFGVDSFDIGSYDYIIDAIDSLKDKTLLILMATQTEARFFSSMGAALKLDPTKIKTAEFWKVQGDPLARALRKRFKRVEGAMGSGTFAPFCKAKMFSGLLYYLLIPT